MAGRDWRRRLRPLKRALVMLRAPHSIPLWPDAVGTRGDEEPSLTPYLLHSRQRTAATIVCPGGGYTMRVAHEGAPVARWLNRLGIAAFVLNYRVAPHRYPAPFEDAQRAVRLVRARADLWRIDPQRVGMLGFSAGGHLAAMTGTTIAAGDPEASDPVERCSRRPDLLILGYPLISLQLQQHDPGVWVLLGSRPDSALCRQLSAEAQVTAVTPPSFLWHAADDGLPVEHSLLFASALGAHRVPVELHVFASGGHGQGLARRHPQLRPWTALCARWLTQRGFR